MIYPESYIFVFVLNTVLAIPIGISVRTLLAMKERLIVPILRVRTATGEIRAITFQHTPLVHEPISRFRDYVPAIPVQIIQIIPPRRRS
jgi:hypothetical protein